MRSRYEWNIGRRTLALGERTLIMGVVNVTPDSFSDGGLYATSARAVEHALRLLEEGADILDIGGESTRPGAAVANVAGKRRATVSAQEEIDRVLPVIEGVRRARKDAVISVDSYKAETARAAVAAGAEIVNDVSGLQWDPAMAAEIAELGCGAVLMHTRGQPEEWASLPKLENPVPLVMRELQRSAEQAVAAGVERSRIVLDPGFGFGKRYGENFPLLARFGDFAELGFPLLAGPSRKSFIGRPVGRRIAALTGGEAQDQPPSERLAGTIAAVTACILRGAHIVRVHDVRPALEAAAIADEILAAT